MTTQPGEWARSAESWGAGVWAAAGSSRHASSAKPTTEARRHGENWLRTAEALPRMNADGRGFSDGCIRARACVAPFAGDVKNDFDLLIENASHSDESMGIRICAAGGDGCSVGTQLLWPRTEARKRASIPGQGFLAFGPLVVAEVRTE